MSVEVARTPIYPDYPNGGFDALDSSSGDTDEFIRSVKDSLQRGRYDTNKANRRFGVVNSEDEQPSLSLDDEAEGRGGGSLTESVELPTSDDEESKWLSPDSLQNKLLKVKQSSPGVEDLVLNYPNESVKHEGAIGDDRISQLPSDIGREEKDLLSMVLDEIPDYPSNSATPLLTSVEIANMSVRQKMQQELQNSRESVLRLEQFHQQEITRLKEMLEVAKIERRNERDQLQQKINSLQKELEATKRKMKNMGRDHAVLIERTKEAEQVAQKIGIDNIQNKMLLNHEQDINKLKKVHKTEMIKLQQLLKEKEQEVKLFSQQLHEERDLLASVKLQLEECRRDNHIKVNKMKSELASKTEDYHRQVKKEKSLAVAKALEEANLQKNKEIHELQLKCQEDKIVALSKMERKFTTQLAEELQRKEQLKRDHVTTPTQGFANNKNVERIIQDHSSEKIKWEQRVHQLEQELQQCKNEMKSIQQQHKEASHQHDKESKAVAMEIMEECHKMSTLLMKRLRSGKKPITSCWAAIVQLKNTNEELANQIKELRTRLKQEKQCAVKINCERLTEIRKHQNSASSTKRKSYEEQQLEKQITALNNQLMILNKEHLLLEAEVKKLRI